MGMAKKGVGLIVIGAATALVLSACGGGSSSSSAGSSTPTKGGTIYYLTNADQFDQIDPQRVYTGEDLAFFNGTIYRTLTAYKFSADNTQGTSLVPDMATNTGTVSNGGKTWSFTLKDGVKFQDGTPVTCADVKYGVSRTFATDVITGGPTYAISYLDIPTNKDGSSAYAGPYKKTGQALYDKAVTCSTDNKTITFNLKVPVPDFNYTVTLTAFAAVPQSKDTGATYGNAPQSDGPYMIQSDQTGKGGKLTMVRNPNWRASTDSYRGAYPDSWVVNYGIDPKVIDQRVMQSSGNDTNAIDLVVQPENLNVVYQNSTTANSQYTGRAISALDPYVRYLAINTKLIPDQKVREAIVVAMDRDALRKNAGGTFAGDFADGVIKPNEGQDYAPTNIWTSLYGQQIPSSGDPTLAKQLLAKAGKSNLTITYDYPQSPVADKSAAIIVASLGKAGITVKPNPIEAGQYYGVVMDPTKAHELISAGWAADWPNGSTIIPQLFAAGGGFNLSLYNDPTYNAAAKAASVNLDRAAQAKQWQQLNTQAMAQSLVVPTLFSRDQRMTGTKVDAVGGEYLWPAYGSWPYAQMYVKQ